MKRTRTYAVGLLLLILPGFAVGQTGPIEQSSQEPPNANAEFIASMLPNGSPPDVELPAGTDLRQWRIDTLGLAPEEYVAPVIISAADGNGDGQASDYFFSFGTGMYNHTDGCHMAPAYLPHGGLTDTVTVDNLFIFAIDNNAGIDANYALWRKDTLSTASPTIMASVSTIGASTNIQILGDTSVVDPVVTRDYAYYITWCAVDSNSILGFWIFYTES